MATSSSADRREEKNVSNGRFGVSMDKAWRLVFPPCPGNDSPFQVPCEGYALGASAIWICGVWSSGHSSTHGLFSQETPKLLEMVTIRWIFTGLVKQPQNILGYYQVTSLNIFLRCLEQE